MSLNIKKKYNEGKKLAVITILGIQGGKVENGKVTIFDINNKAKYNFPNQPKEEYFNMFPLLVKKYSQKYKIIPITTKEAKIFNEEILKKSDPNLSKKINFDDYCLIEDEKNIDKIFKLYNDIFNEFDEIIVDVTHGFRHLPLLMIVELIMQNFKSVDKIKHIYFAKEIVKHTINQQGDYEIVDLKEYLDIANISFVLTNFSKNFTVANHIKSIRYKELIDYLNEFSNDIMALNLNNLFKNSSKNLIESLKSVTNISIVSQANELSDEIKKITEYKDKKRYQNYLYLAELLHEKNYILLSITLLYESIRLYIKTTIKKQHKKIVEKIEKILDDNLYAIGDFFIQFKDKDYTYDKCKKRNKQCIIDLQEFNQIKEVFPTIIMKNYKFDINNNKDKSLLETIAHSRNDLAHANADKSFKDIKKNTKELIEKYKSLI